ncbi:MAG: hypothetical protein IJU50_10210 [Lachnospiraceae bacterium]|nr:hypothetical protein [Lachnospiraceae bacterium]
MYKPRDYSKPLFIRLKGLQGLKAYIKILKAPAVKYDAEKAAEEALKNLRKQGAKI